MSKVHDAIKIIKELTVTELIQLFGELKETFGITEDMLQVGSSSSADSDESKATTAAVDPNKKVSLVLSNIGGESKLAFIKAMKEVLSMSLSDAGAKFTEASAGTSTVLQSDLARKDAEEMITKFKTHLATATIEIK